VSAQDTLDIKDEFASFTRTMTEEDEHKPWGLVIGFTILINMANLSGVAFLQGLILGKNNL